MKPRRVTDGSNNNAGAKATRTTRATSPPLSSPRNTSTSSSNSRRTSASEEEVFEARRSSRIAANKYSQHDGDCWQETLAVCELPDSNSSSNSQVKMTIRSYYCNQRTGDRIWDEPPSGASKILSATPEMRSMAEAQLQEMQLTFGYPHDYSNGNEGQSSSSEKKRGFFRKSKTAASPSSPSTAQATSPRPKLTYKPGSFLSQVKKSGKTNKQSKRRTHDESLDPEIQKAIALSINDVSSRSTATPSSSSATATATAASISQQHDDDDELAMVMALSLSEQEHQQRQAQTSTPTLLSEEEMFQRALVESRRSTSTSAVAAMPIKDDYSTLGLSLGRSSQSSSLSQETAKHNKKRHSKTSNRKSVAHDSAKAVATKGSNAFSENEDQKMPAKPTVKPSVAPRHENDAGRKKEQAIVKSNTHCSVPCQHQQPREQAVAAATRKTTTTKTTKKPIGEPTTTTVNAATTKPATTTTRQGGTRHSSARSSSQSTDTSKIFRSDGRDNQPPSTSLTSPRTSSFGRTSSSTSTSSASSKYGKSVRPASSKHLPIDRAPSGGSGHDTSSRTSLPVVDNANDETKRTFASSKATFSVSEKRKHIVTSSTVASSEYTRGSRAADRSLFGSK